MKKKREEKTVRKKNVKPKVKTVKIVDPDKPSEKMSRRMLERYVQKHAREVNKQLEKYRNNPKEWENVDERFKRTFERAQEAGTGKGKNKGKPILYTDYRNKKKEELLLLARRIQEMERFSLEESDEEQNRKFEQSYETFLKNHVPSDMQDDIDKDTYRELIDVFGAGGSFMKDFGYEDYIQLVTDKIVEGYTARDVIKAAREVSDEINGMGLDTEEALDKLREKLSK